MAALWFSRSLNSMSLRTEVHILDSALPVVSTSVCSTGVAPTIGFKEDKADAFKDFEDGVHALAELDPLQIANSLQKCHSLAQVRRCHCHITYIELNSDLYLSNLLVSMYAKYGDLKDSRSVFDNVRDRNVVTWTAILTAHARKGQTKEAIFLYKRMLEEAKAPNNVTFITLFSVCISKQILAEGKRMHASLSQDMLRDVTLGTALVSMYGKCGALQDARTTFDRLMCGNIVTWNAMITAYADHDMGKEALQVFWLMQTNGLEPNDCTYINSFKACAIQGDVLQGRIIHSSIVENGLINDSAVVNSLINMYGKCKMTKEARCVFSQMEKHDLITWNAIITAYAQQSLGAEVLEIFRNMRQQGVKPDMITYINVASACASLTAIEEGKWIHACIINEGLESEVQIGNVLIHMYGRCGELGLARTVFDRIRPHNVISWTAIIDAFAQQGHAKAALQLFREMQKGHVKPDEITYITVLSACSHAGLVEEGRSCFLSMEKEGFAPRVEHYVCMIDLFGRAGMLAEAEEFIQKLPCWSDGRPWSALLSSCRLHSDTNRGKIAADQIIKLGPEDTGPYVLLSNLYAANNRKADPQSIQKVMDKMLKIL